MAGTVTASIKAAHPNDVESLTLKLAERDAMVLERDLLIEKLKLQIARMKRVRFGASSEKLDTEIVQLELIVEDLESTLSAHEAHVVAASTAAKAADPTHPCADLTSASSAPARRALPEHLPRERVVYEPKHHGLAVSPAVVN